MHPATSTKRIFAFTAARRILILTDHVVRKQSLRPGTGGIPFSERLPSSQFRRRGAHREVRLWRRIAEDAGRPLPDDGDSDDHDVRPVHAPVGRGLSEVSAIQRGEKVSSARATAYEFAEIQ